ncbi:OLC1v1027385C1 [Oldenlandia corymbosa var. corymbosa]|uniref:DNA mismatch repair protein n=1 Tax=Oldenlandia corymbosa var. corymbosa TaxID=529605 RepID=A0AAV1CC23_OLDCO|nr:OLC1v1027385C1 [Oldenlandia corymbosa var. corymbosa]
MKKQKQQVISRFFAPKSKTQQKPSSSDYPPSSSSSLPTSQSQPPTPPPKISATVAFSPSKRLRTSQLISSSPQSNSKAPKLLHFSDDDSQQYLFSHKPSKKPKFSPHTHNPIPPLPDPVIHKKFLEKLLEPSQEWLEPSRNRQNLNQPKYTPLEEQVVELKAKYPDVLLMVEVGYKYRFFGEDAENAARVLGIYAHMDHNFLTASIPTFRLNVHVRRLVSAGYKVGVVKQTETAAIKAHGANKAGPFCRGLSALYTKATLEAGEDLGGEEEGCSSVNNYLVCVVEQEVENGQGANESRVDVKLGIIGVEISTGDVVFGEFEDDFMRSSLESIILNLSPAELILANPLSKQTEKLLLAYAGPASNVRVEHGSRDCFADGGALAEVMSLFEEMAENKLVNSCNGEDGEVRVEDSECPAIKGIMALPNLAVQALGLTIRHLKQFGLERILCMEASFRPLCTKIEMTLSANALQQLEILKNNADGSECGTLLQCMNHTLTIFGSRLLRHWVSHPLCDNSMINARLDAVSEIVESMDSIKASSNLESDGGSSGILVIKPEIHQILSSVLTFLSRSPDIQRGITRVFHRTATASEFIAVIRAILLAGKQLEKLHVQEEDDCVTMQTKTICSPLLRKLIESASSSSLMSTAEKLLCGLNEEAADQKDIHNLFVVDNGQFSEVANARTKVELAKEKLDSLIRTYRKQLKEHNLAFMSVSGVTHLIELPLNVKVPSNWVKVNSTKKTIRYHPPEVLAALDQLSLANEELTLISQTAWDSYLKDFGRHYAEFQAAVQALAALDCLHSLSILARNENYVHPTFVSDSDPMQIQIIAGRHPVMETVLLDNFVPNDTNLHAKGECCQVITGPNMGGKSCYIRQVALIAIMAQVGSFVPALSAKLHVIDCIYTRMGASDSIQQGRSTFLEELSEASHILHNCTTRSLVIIDELGRGTSTHDGVAMAYATLHYLLANKRCMVLFVTHYPEIVDIKDEFPGSVSAYHVSYLTSQKDEQLDTDSNLNMDDMIQDNITYLYKLVPGISERSFGFKVAQLAELPLSCIRRAILMATRLEAAVCNREKLRLANTCFSDKGSSPSQEVEGEKDEKAVEMFHKSLDLCKQFFRYFNSAISGETDVAERFKNLKLAKNLAVELINRC